MVGPVREGARGCEPGAARAAGGEKHTPDTDLSAQDGGGGRDRDGAPGTTHRPVSRGPAARSRSGLPASLSGGGSPVRSP